MSLKNSIQLLAEIIGGFEVWDDFDTKDLCIRTFSDNKIHRISYIEFALARSDQEIFDKIIGIIGQKEIEASQPFLLEEDNSNKAKRIKALNAELDIIRGRVPTPKGYIVDVARAKTLLAELKELLK